MCLGVMVFQKLEHVGAGENFAYHLIELLNYKCGN